MKTFKQHINEAKYKPGEVQSKDWTRMMDLVLADKDGASTAAKLKDKDKAIARYIAGTKLKYSNDVKWDWNDFEAFGNKAIELGATKEELETFLSNTEIPTKVYDKYKSLKNKKLDNRFVGEISKKLIKMGYDIKFLPHNGNAITGEGRYAMERNGRKWTIGYKTELTKDNEKFSLVFDAITDEGDGPTSYVIDELKNLNTGENLNPGYNDVLGQRKFIAELEKALG